MSNSKMMRGYCPLVEEFHIRNIVGCLEKKQWIFGDTITLSAGAQTLSLLTLSGGLIEQVPVNPKTALPNYLVLVQGVGFNSPYVDTQTVKDFVVHGTAGQSVDVVVMATGPSKPSRKVSTSKWADDYCPYCRAAGFKGIVGSVFKDIVCFSFKYIATANPNTVKFNIVTDTTGKFVNVPGYPDEFFETGQELPARVTMMANTDYQIIITKQDLGAYIPPTNYPQITGRAKDGFTVRADIGTEYDALILGQIQF